MDTLDDPRAAGANPMCRSLGIAAPDLAQLKDHREANTYALLIVALLERGVPMTLAEVAERFADAGVASCERALLSLKRCKPARAPVYRDGDHYALDLHDDELDLWLFRLGLRGPRFSVPEPPAEPPEAPPRPGPDEPLSPDELADGWRGNAPWSTFSPQRLAIAILDAHGGAMSADETIAFADRHAGARRLGPDAAQSWRSGAPVQATPDGRWVLDRHHPAVASARAAVRDRVALARKWARRSRQSSDEIEASIRESERQSAAQAAELALLRRAIVHAFPPEAPVAVVLVDVAERRIEELTVRAGSEWLDAVRARLAPYDVIAGLGVREIVRGIGFTPGERRLVDLGPPQKSLQLNRRGRTLKITTAMLVAGSCGISRPLGDPAVLHGYLRAGDHTRLVRRLQADAKSLFWLYEYGRLHGTVRLRWGFLDERFGAPWAHRDETKLYALCKLAMQLGVPLEVVAGSAPGWAEPWARIQRCTVGEHAYEFFLLDEAGQLVNLDDVQLARLERVERTLH